MRRFNLVKPKLTVLSVIRYCDIKTLIMIIRETHLQLVTTNITDIWLQMDAHCSLSVVGVSLTFVLRLNNRGACSGRGNAATTAANDANGGVCCLTRTTVTAFDQL